MSFLLQKSKRRLIQTKVYNRFFYSVWKETTHKPSKVEQLRKTFSPVCMLLVQLAAINYFYSMWQLKDNVFLQKFIVTLRLFHPPRSCVVWNKWFEISPYFNLYLRNTNTKVKVQCKYQSSKMKLSYTTKMKLSYTMLKTLQSVFDHCY